MKTNQIMVTQDRMLLGQIVRQQTINEFLSVTDLLKAYESKRVENGWVMKDLNAVMKTKAFVERTYHLLNELGILEPRNMGSTISQKLSLNDFNTLVNEHGVVETLKFFGVWKNTKRDGERSVYCNPYIWCLIAMELNPLLYAKVVIWMTDTLILDRVNASNHFRSMNDAIASIIPAPEYWRYAKNINKRVFYKHEKEIRNSATSQQLKMIEDIEKFISQSIYAGYLKTEKEIFNAIYNFK